MLDATSARLALAALAAAAAPAAPAAATPAAATPAAPAAGALWTRRDPGPSEPRPYQLVAERICELVRQTGVKPGQRLPSERELSNTLAVSRPSLREAMIALELSGIIEVRHGSGVYLCEPPQKAARVPEAGPGPFELLSARRLIEPELAAMAARMATDGAIDTILVAAADMERLQDDKSRCELADRNFHLSIARATGNSALAGVLEYLWNQRGSLWHTLEELYETDELRKQTLDDHRRIVGAIAGRNPSAARQAMRAHLERVARTLSRS